MQTPEQILWQYTDKQLRILAVDCRRADKASPISSTYAAPCGHRARGWMPCCLACVEGEIERRKAEATCKDCLQVRDEAEPEANDVVPH